jgi:hypothetical protein
MALEVYYPADIRNALLAAEQSAAAAIGATSVKDELSQGYWLSGYRAALTTIALAFGLVSNGTEIREVKHNLLRPCG